MSPVLGFSIQARHRHPGANPAEGEQDGEGAGTHDIQDKAVNQVCSALRRKDTGRSYCHRKYLTGGQEKTGPDTY